MTLSSLAAALDAAPRTTALAQALATTQDNGAIADLMFLENWEFRPSFDLGSALRARQLRRANPVLADAIRAEADRPRLVAAE